MRRLLIGVVVLLLAGCGGKYACKGYPEGVTCKSAREVYEMTNYRDSLGGSLDGKKKGPSSNGDKNGDKPGSLGYLTPAEAASAAAVQGLGYNGPMPLRSQAQVMRVWLAPWEDLEGSLHMPTYIYAEVAERRWSIGEGRMEVAPPITPLLDKSLPEETGRKAATKPPAARKPTAAGKSSKDLSDFGPPRINPNPVPTLDTSIKKPQNASKTPFFNRKTGTVNSNNYFGTE